MSSVPRPSNVTLLLQAFRRGHRTALDDLLPVIYEELRNIAKARLRTERPDHTLGATALVHEAYLRLVDIDRVDWKSRVHFLAMASRVMRRILVDHARRRAATKRGGARARVPLDEGCLVSEEDAELLLELDDALLRLRSESPRVVDALELRYLGGMLNEEVAAALGVSVATVERDLCFGRAWLARDWSSCRAER